MKLALEIPAQLDRGAHDGLIEVPEFLHVKQDQLRQVQQVPSALRKHWNAAVGCTRDQAKIIAEKEPTKACKRCNAVNHD